MTKPNDTDVSIDLLALLQKHRNALAFFLSLSLCASAVLMLAIPKQYKSKVIISIQPNYFQNPLAIGIDTHEVLELKNQRELMLKKALNNSFLDEMAEKYRDLRSDLELVRTVPAPPPSTEEREKIRRKFEIFFLNSMTFQVSFVAPEPKTAFLVIQDSTRRILSFLEESRRNTILATQRAIQEDLEAMGQPSENPTIHSNATAGENTKRSSGDPEDIETYQKELTQLETKLHLIQAIYSPSHPELRHLQNHIKDLKNWIDAAQPTGTPSGVWKMTRSNSNIYEDLLRKWHYLNVTLSLEREKDNPQILLIEAPALFQQPIWPKFDSIAPGCLGAGFVLFLLWVLGYEWLNQKNPAKP